jgi:hypothetical protein
MASLFLDAPAVGRAFFMFDTFSRRRGKKPMKTQRVRIAVLSLILLTIALCAFGLAGYYSLVQRVNISKQTYGPCTFKNAAASNDSVGKVGGSISVTCGGLSVPAAPAPVTQFDFDTVGQSAWIAYGNRKNADGTPKDTISIEGTYDADSSTERLINPKVVGMKVNGNAVVPSSN